jgi:hypothetical protein
MTDPSLPKKLNIFQLFDGAFSARIHNALRVRPHSKSMGDQSTDGGSGHEASFGNLPQIQSTSKQHYCLFPSLLKLVAEALHLTC